VLEIGRHRTFARAWTCYRFHEDGFTSCLCAAAALPGVAPRFYYYYDADVECEGTHVDAMTRLFDALEATHALTACREGPARHGEGDRTD
jgi:hypothetical protein